MITNNSHIQAAIDLFDACGEAQILTSPCFKHRIEIFELESGSMIASTLVMKDGEYSLVKMAMTEDGDELVEYIDEEIAKISPDH